MPLNTIWLSSASSGQAWLPAAFNGGHAYHDRVHQPAPSVLAFYTERYTHSGRAVWRERLADGEIWRNGQLLLADAPLAAGDRLVWHRPPWQEAAVPVLSEASIVFDDDDLLVLNKPSGLPVLPAGGFLQHTLLEQLEAWVERGVITSVGGVPRPVHRLGRFTSGLLVCARRSSSRAWLSTELRESTLRSIAAEQAGSCRKIYRAITHPLPPDWKVDESRSIKSPIGRVPHPRLGMIWGHASDSDQHALPAHSEIKLLQRSESACLVDVSIATGRPHQIRIHAASVGAPLMGDPLYLPGGFTQSHALPGDGGYYLHAYRLRISRQGSKRINLQAPLPRVISQFR